MGRFTHPDGWRAIAHRFGGGEIAPVSLMAGGPTAHAHCIRCNVAFHIDEEPAAPLDFYCPRHRREMAKPIEVPQLEPLEVPALAPFAKTPAASPSSDAWKRWDEQARSWAIGAGLGEAVVEAIAPTAGPVAKLVGRALGALFVDAIAKPVKKVPF